VHALILIAVNIHFQQAQAVSIIVGKMVLIQETGSPKLLFENLDSLTQYIKLHPDRDSLDIIGNTRTVRAVSQMDCFGYH